MHARGVLLCSSRQVYSLLPALHPDALQSLLTQCLSHVAAIAKLALLNSDAVCRLGAAVKQGLRCRSMEMAVWPSSVSEQGPLPVMDS